MKLPLYLYLVVLCAFLFPTTLTAQAGPPPGGSRPGGNRGDGGSSGLVAVAQLDVSRVFTTVAGRLEPRLRIDHKVPLTGIVTDVLVAAGQQVSRGMVLFTVVQDSPLDIYKPVEVVSRLEGIVSDVALVTQQDAVSGTIGVTVMETTNMKLEAAVSDTDAFAFSPGIRVTGRNAAGDSISGTLLGISSEPDYDTGLFTARFTFPRTPGMPIGTFLIIDVPVAEVRGVFVDPDSVIRRYGRNRIWTVDADDNLYSVEVQTGQVVGGRLLIQDGLEPETRYLKVPTGREQEGMSLSELLEARE